MKAFEIVYQVLEEMYADVPGASEAEKDTLVLAALDKYQDDYDDLKTENGADHSSHTNRFAYIYKYVTSHANIVYNTIKDSAELRGLFDREFVDVACFGGGPGSDLLGILKFLEEAKKDPYVTCFLYDRERRWSNCWNDVGKKLSGNIRFTVAFEPIDVCELAHLSYLKKCYTADLISMIFFVSEVYAVKDKATPFFQDVFSKAKQGAFFLYADNGDRDGDFERWIDQMATSNGFHILDEVTKKFPIYDRGEERSALGRFLDKYSDKHHPKMKPYVTVKIYQKE
jgi:hypothetical protein